MSVEAAKAQAEYICGCRSCGSHCMIVERVASVEVPGEVLFTDGYRGGWLGVQTEVVTCPHCRIVMSWRKNCVDAEQLRQSGDLGRFYLPPPGWGPPSVYWAGFRRYDDIFHSGEDPIADGVLPRLSKPPEADAAWALRKRGWIARGLLWLDNDRERIEVFFGGERPAPRKDEDYRRRALLLRALLEAALLGGDASEANALDAAEWHRELGEWDEALRALDRNFIDPLLDLRATQLHELVIGRNADVAAFEPGPDPQVAIELERARERQRQEEAAREREQKARRERAAPAPVPVKPAATAAPVTPPAVAAPAIAAPAAAVPAAAAKPEPRKPAQGLPPKSPRALLATLGEVLGTMPADILTRDHIPRPYGSLLRTLMKSYGWDEGSFAVSVIRGFARAHGWPSDADATARGELEAFPVDEEVLDYLATAFKRASWDQWAFDVPSTAAPRREA